MMEKIYLKKESGEIIEYPENHSKLIDLNKQMRSMERIKEVSEIAKRELTKIEIQNIVFEENKKIGIIYKKNDLPLDDKLSLNFITQKEYDEKVKEINDKEELERIEKEKKEEIQNELIKMAEERIELNKQGK